jgi:hypothetical protein
MPIGSGFFYGLRIRPQRFSLQPFLSKAGWLFALTPIDATPYFSLRFYFYGLNPLCTVAL